MPHVTQVENSDFKPHIVLAVEEISQIHGGVERTVINLANYLIEHGYKVTLLTSEPEKHGDPAYELDSRVERCDVGLISYDIDNLQRQDQSALKERLPRVVVRLIQNLLAIKRIWSVRRREVPIIQQALQEIKADIVVSFKTHYHRYIIPAAVRAGIPVIASEHNPPSVLYYHYVCFIDRYVIWFYLKFASCIRVLIPTFINEYPRKLRGLCEAIPNGITLPESVEKEDKAQKKIVNVGRLYFQKDQETLIRAFSLLAKNHPNWSVEIYGDGEMKGYLSAFISDLKLTGRVTLMGATNDPMSAYKKADIFAMPSLFEGFGNVTLEAMSCGLPVVAFDNGDGNNILIENRVNGLLVEKSSRVESFASGLEALMQDEVLRSRMSIESRKAAEKFEILNVMRLWEECIKRSLR